MSATIVITADSTTSEPLSALSAARMAAAQKYGDSIRALRVSEDGTARPLPDDGSLYPLLTAYLKNLDDIDAKYAVAAEV